MIFLTNVVALVWLCLLLVVPVFIFMVFYLVAKARGIERALWAVVSQLQAIRREEHDPVQVAQGRGGREVPAPTGMISTSMFGR